MAKLAEPLEEYCEPPVKDVRDLETIQDDTPTTPDD